MSRERRKNDHVKLALETASVSPVADFDEVRFVHQSFPETSTDSVSISTRLGALLLRSPIYMNAMTGGSQWTAEINQQLASVAAETGIAMAVGSQHSGLNDASLADTFRVVRRQNPSGIIFANIGAGAPIDFAKRAVDMLQADVLQIHVNAPQELVMPEGDRDFRGWLHAVERMVGAVEVPVVVKEVGFGMSAETIRALQQMGVDGVDLGGRGGTDFIWIENARRKGRELKYLTGWGQSTAVSLLEAQPFMEDLEILASGGIRHALDMVKCLSLGARAVGIAGPILRLLKQAGPEAVIKQILAWHDELGMLFTLLGARTIEDLQTAPVVVTGSVREWCEVRGVDITRLARRGS